MHLIITQGELEAAIAKFETAEFVTVDTEFIRETTYWPELCLIQIAMPEASALIDPLSPDIDLAPFFRLMANEKIVKVFHAARQDIEIIFNRGGLIPPPVFDTQVAAMVCGFGDSISFSNLARRLAGVDIDKTSQFTDWSRRPLSPKQLHYALGDVIHLRPIYEKLSAELDRTGRASWLDEEMAGLMSHETYEQHPERAQPDRGHDPARLRRPPPPDRPRGDERDHEEPRRPPQPAIHPVPPTRGLADRFQRPIVVPRAPAPSPRNRGV